MIKEAKIIIIRTFQGAKIIVRDETEGLGKIIRTYECPNDDSPTTFGIDEARRISKAIQKQMNKEKIEYHFFDKY